MNININYIIIFIMNLPVPDSDEEYDFEEYHKELTTSEKLYLGACAILAVSLLFMASNKLK